jgi:hypothetical protein
MKHFTGFEYLLIDVANQFGHDKWDFEPRIQWAMDNLANLEALTEQADKKTKPLYIKAVQAVRKAQAGIPTGHLVGFDASCSGLQIMSAVTGCIVGAKASGLVDPNHRADAYASLTESINSLLNDMGMSVSVPRDNAKTALMTVLYGSKAEPIKIFGENTPELKAFYEAVVELAPGAWELLQDLISSWDQEALMHAWQLPDGFEAKVKVMTKHEDRIEVDELDHATFTYSYKENAPKEHGVSNAANVVHSLDGYLLRCIHRRCNYDKELARYALDMIQDELDDRGCGWGKAPADECKSNKVNYYMGLYAKHGIADIVILPYLNQGTVGHLTTDHLQKLGSILKSMLAHEPFELITIHDEFKCHANNMNHLRQHYINVMAELADSTVLNSIFNDLYGVTEMVYMKNSTNLSTHIRNSNYALC